jgi:hypothetical protein
MRSDLVFGAMGDVPNRYLLTRLASKAVRAMHKPGVRIADTTNDVLERFSRANPIASNQPLRKPRAVPGDNTKSFAAPPRKAKVVVAIPPPSEIWNPQWEEVRAGQA